MAEQIKGLINLTETFDVANAVEVQRYINEGFKFVKFDLTIKSADFTKFIETIGKHHNLVEYNYSKNKHSSEIMYKNTNFCISAKGSSKDMFIDIFSKTEESLNELYKEYIAYSELDDPEIECFLDSYYIKNGNIETLTNVKYFKDYQNLDEDYYPYLDVDILFEQFAAGNENILILVGEPGLGKSKFASTILKHAFLNPDKLPYDKLEDNSDLDDQFISAAYIKSTDVLSSDAFWRKLENVTPDFVFIDDLDYMLTKRDSEIVTHEDTVKNNFLNQFLSFTDGISKNKTKFIITTNQEFDSIDSAILRKGRIFDILELRKLHKEEAKKIWLKNELLEEDFEKHFSDEILPANLGSEIAKRKNKRISQNKIYLKEQSISKITKTKKRLGL